MVTHLEKKLNKWLANLVIGQTIGLGTLSPAPKGKALWRRILHTLQLGIGELKKVLK